MSLESETKCDFLFFFLFLTAVIAQEKGQQQLRQGIESFDSTKLKHAETQEKNPLPTAEAIAQEKTN